MAKLSEGIIETIDIDSIQPHPLNANEGDVGAISTMIEARDLYGVIQVQRSTGNILAGNHRWKAAKALGLKEIRVEWQDVSDAEAVALMVGDNRASELASTDDVQLAELLQGLVEDGLLEVAGYDTEDMGNLVGSLQGFVDPEPSLAEEALEKWGVQPGDVWHAGAQTVVCGSCLDSANHVYGTADCVWTDPPYGVDYAKAVDGSGNKRRTDAIQNDNLSHSELEALWFGAFKEVGDRTKPGGAYYISAPQGDLLLLLLQSMDKAGFLPRHMLVWVKDSLVLGRSDYHYRHEPIFYGWKKGAAHTWQGGRKQTSVLEFPRPRASKAHPTMKPVDLIARCLANSCTAGAAVVDPFCGSGSTLLACEQLGMCGYGIEVDPKYAAVTLERLSALGLSPTKA